MYGMVGTSSSGAAGAGNAPRREKSLSRRSRRSLSQYQRQASFTAEFGSSGCSRTSSCGANMRIKKIPFNRSATVIGNRSTPVAGGADSLVISNKNNSSTTRRSCSATLYENQETDSRRTERNDKHKNNTIVTIEGQEKQGEGETTLDKDDPNYRPHRHRSRRSNRSFYRKLITLLKQAWGGVKFGSDSEEEEIELEPFIRPHDINSLCKATNFSRSELQRLYRSFKDKCPTGVVTECAFKEIYCQMFPRGASASQYAHYVFLTLDRNGEGTINFEDLIRLLSRLSRGTLADRLCWIFSLYDLNNDGYISRSEMLEVVQAVYDLLGKQTTTPVDGQTVEEKVDFLFETFDTNKDDLISLEEFIDACSKDITLIQNLDVMSTYL